MSDERPDEEQINAYNAALERGIGFIEESQNALQANIPLYLSVTRSRGDGVVADVIASLVSDIIQAVYARDMRRLNSVVGAAIGFGYTTMQAKMTEDKRISNMAVVQQAEAIVIETAARSVEPPKETDA